MFENISVDIKMSSSGYGGISGVKKIFYLLMNQELYAVLIYRFGRWANYDFHVPILKCLLRIVYLFLRKLSCMAFSIEIWPESEVGPGLKIEHWGCVQIKAKIGKNCRIQQQVIIGHKGGFQGGGVPNIGDNVYIGMGAKIIGEVNVGNNVIIGANAVVLKDIPDNAVAVGIPAKVIKFRK